MEIIQATLLLLHLMAGQLARSRGIHAHNFRVRTLNCAVNIGTYNLILAWHVIRAEQLVLFNISHSIILT